LQGAPCAVALAPWGYARREEHRVERVVVGFDGSDEARLALTDATELAGLLGARLELVGVVPPLPIPDPDLADAAVAELRRLLEDAAPPGSAVTVVSGEPAEELARAASGPGDLLAVGSRGYGPLKRVLLGSVSAALVRGAARCPLLVRPRADG
jgi:nucleotide-binding universal stress UspA family protein